MTYILYSYYVSWKQSQIKALWEKLEKRVQKKLNRISPFFQLPPLKIYIPSYNQLRIWITLVYIYMYRPPALTLENVHFTHKVPKYIYTFRMIFQQAGLTNAAGLRNCYWKTGTEPLVNSVQEPRGWAEKQVRTWDFRIAHSVCPEKWQIIREWLSMNIWKGSQTKLLAT